MVHAWHVAINTFFTNLVGTICPKPMLGAQPYGKILEGRDVCAHAFDHHRKQQSLFSQGHAGSGVYTVSELRFC